METKKKMKLRACHILLIPLFFGISQSCSNKDDLGDDAAEFFVKYYGNTEADGGFDIKHTSDGGFAIFGTRSYSGTGSDFVLIKTDEYGNLQWERNYGGPRDDIGRSFEILSDGSFVMVGTYRNGGDILDPVGNALDGYVVWASSDGTLTDTARIDFVGDNPPGDRTNDELFGVAADKVGGSGQILVIGYSTAQAQSAFGGLDSISNALGKANILFTRMDKNSIIQQYSMGFEEDDIGYDVIQIPQGNANAGNYIFTGTTEPDATNQTVFIAQYAQYGTDEFSYLGTNINNTDLENLVCQARSIEFVDDQEMYISGHTGSSSSSQIFLITGSVSDFFSGSITVSLFGESGLNNGFGMDRTSDGSIVIAGNTSVASKVQGETDHYLLKINTQGSLDWDKTYGGTGAETSNAVIVTNDGGFAMIGVSDFESNALINLVKTDSKGQVGN